MDFKQQMSETFRRSLLVGIPIATVVGLTALAYAVPNVFSAGQGLSSAAMNANFTSLEAENTAQEAEIGGPGITTSLQAQITALQNQVNALPTPPAGLTYYTFPQQAAEDYVGGTQYIDTGVTVSPSTTVNCVAVASCVLPAADCPTTIASLSFGYNNPYVSYQGLGEWNIPVARTNNTCGATVNGFLQIPAGEPTTVLIQVSNLADSSGGLNIVCNFTMQCL